MNELGPGDHLPPVREHVRWVSGQLADQDDPSLFVGSAIVCRTHDEGAADRAAALYARTYLRARAPTVRRMGVLDAETERMINDLAARMLAPGEVLSKPFDYVHLRPICRADRQVVTRRRVKGKQAKDIDSLSVLWVVRKLTEDGTWTNRFEIERQWPNYPSRVVLAKLGRLINRGYMTGCTCGCSGDLELTAKGREALSSGQGLAG